jgi:hypothetical protein
VSASTQDCLRLVALLNGQVHGEMRKSDEERVDGAPHRTLPRTSWVIFGPWSFNYPFLQRLQLDAFSHRLY